MPAASAWGRRPSCPAHPARAPPAGPASLRRPLRGRAPGGRPLMHGAPPPSPLTGQRTRLCHRPVVSRPPVCGPTARPHRPAPWRSVTAHGAKAFRRVRTLVHVRVTDTLVASAAVVGSRALCVAAFQGLSHRHARRSPARPVSAGRDFPATLDVLVAQRLREPTPGGSAWGVGSAERPASRCVSPLGRQSRRPGFSLPRPRPSSTASGRGVCFLCSV